VGQEERTGAVAATFDRSWSEMLASPGWWPDRWQAECIRLARTAGGAAAALESDDYVDALCSSLVRWKAFRGTPFDRGRVVSSLRAAAPLLAPWEGVSILRLPARRVPELFELFEAVRDIKPTTRKWVVTSKTLHHLLPDLVVPMDNIMTAPFLGTSALPATFDAAFLVEACAAFRGLAAAIGPSRVRAAARDAPYPVAGYSTRDCRIGHARVLDYAVAGFLMTHDRSDLRLR